MTTTKPSDQIEAAARELYKIKPLEWQEKLDATEEAYFVHVPMGSYKVSRHRLDFEETGDWCGWRSEYCFDEYYDDESFECDSAEHGKQLAWEDWLKRITPALESAKHFQPAADAAVTSDRALSVRPDQTGLDRGWYIVALDRSLEYLNNDGRWQVGCQDRNGNDNAFWPTREAAEKFLADWRA